jgi:hypothetical protein
MFDRPKAYSHKGWAFLFFNNLQTRDTDTFLMSYASYN